MAKISSSLLKGLMIDFGIGYGCTFRNQGMTRPKNILARVEEEMVQLHGRKLFYTKIQLPESSFWKCLGVESDEYYKLKATYDPSAKFLSLYQKLT